MLAIIFEAIIFSSHANEINIINQERLNQKAFGQSLVTAYANARSLLVYFVLFIIAQIFTVILVLDAVSNYRIMTKKRLLFTLPQK